MNIDKNSKEKNYIIYANDYHFFIKVLEYINKRSKFNFFIFTERDLEDKANKIEKLNGIKTEIKNKIKNIDWSNRLLEKIEICNKELEKSNEIYVFIKGTSEYIKKIEKNLDSKKNRINIIRCYEFLKV